MSNQGMSKAVLITSFIISDLTIYNNWWKECLVIPFVIQKYGSNIYLQWDWQIFSWKKLCKTLNSCGASVLIFYYSRVHKKQSTKSLSLRMEGSKIQKLLRERRIETDWQLSGIAWSNKLWWFSWLITLPLGWQKIVSAIWLSQLGFYRIHI